MRALIELIYWVKIFLSPNFFAILIIFILSTIYSYSHWYLLLFIPSIIFGVKLAERARKKYGTSTYFAKPMNTPDIVETWEKEKMRDEVKRENKSTEQEKKS